MSRPPVPAVDGTRQPGRLATVDALRGVAALAVCWYHFTWMSDSAFLSAGMLRRSGKYGYLGVEIFFVISGFVIPYSLYRAAFRARDFGRFLLRRVIRLDPPYFAAIVVTLALDALSSHLPGFRGGAPHDWRALTLLLHIGYLNGIFGRLWVNSVYWTLALEFQFYVLIGIAYPAVASSRNRVRVVTLASLAAASWFLPSPVWVFHYLSLFLFGIAVFHLRTGSLTPRTFFLCLPIIGVMTAVTLAPLVAAVGAATALVIAFVELRSRVFLFLGSISYSLYLLHKQAGGRVINLSLRLPVPAAARVLVVGLAVAASLAFAWAFCYAVERPARRWSKRVGYRRAIAAVDWPADAPDTSTAQR